MKLKMILMVLVLGLYSISMSAQTKKKVPVKKSNTSVSSIIKTREVGEDGFIWYKLKKGNLYGAQDVEGNIIVPIQFTSIGYCCYAPFGSHYFRVYDGDFAGAYTRRGKCVIPTEKHYVSIWLNTALGRRFEKIYWKATRNGGIITILDAQGKEVFSPPSDYEVSHMSHAFDRRTGWSDDYGDVCFFEITHKGEYGKFGICDLEGNLICPVKYNHCYLTQKDDFFELTKDEATEVIVYNASSRFNYNTYDDLCYAFDKISSSSNLSSSNTVASSSSSTYNSSSSTNQSSSSNNNSGSSTTIVVEQHGPVQVWVPCGACGHNPGVCQTCVGMGTSASGRLCISCHGTGKCHFCNGTGGHNEVQYR